MKKVYILLSMIAVIVFCSSCNDEWKDEQYEQYISFKAPINNLGVTSIYIPYYSDQKVSYQLPVIVSGSTDNDKNITVHVGVDSDTLRILNKERFQDREDHHYKELTSEYFSMPETVNINAGENIGLMQIDFSLQGIDLVSNWLLPLTIMEDESYGYEAHPRKNYKKALLHVIPFNEYSGPYSGTALKIYSKGYENLTPIVKRTIETYVVDESTMFFYAGNVDHNRKGREDYKINLKFESLTEKQGEDGDFGNVLLSPASDDNRINFKLNQTASYVITEMMDAVRPYLKHRYVTISNIDYEFTDYTDVEGEEFVYIVSGTLIQERKINTQIPDQDQAIEW